jgi:hypothetical protein
MFPDGGDSDGGDHYCDGGDNDDNDDRMRV